MKNVVGVATDFGNDYKPLVIQAGTKNSQEIELIKEHFRRRHDQFAIRYGWEPISSDGMEQDGYDRFGRCEYVLLANQAGRVGAGLSSHLEHGKIHTSRGNIPRKPHGTGRVCGNFSNDVHPGSGALFTPIPQSSSGISE